MFGALEAPPNARQLWPWRTRHHVETLFARRRREALVEGDEFERRRPMLSRDKGGSQLQSVGRPQLVNP